MTVKKLFRRSLEKQTEIESVEYDPKLQNYREMINGMRDNNYKQVIINSELMINIMENVFLSGGILQKIKLDEGSDEVFHQEIEDLLRKVRNDKKNFVLLKNELSWAEEYDSIDINSMLIFYNGFQSEVKSNGVVIGENPSDIINEVIAPLLKRYLA